MKILLTFDDRYAPHAATLMEELLAQASVPLGFAILHADSLTAPTVETLRRHFEGRVEALDFHRVDPGSMERVTGKKDDGRVPVETYLRLFAPLFVQDEQVVYLDIDIICEGDIAAILDEVRAPRAVWAVSDYNERDRPLGLKPDKRLRTPLGGWEAVEAGYGQRRERLGMRFPMNYFNAGVMVMNLELWRREQLTARTLDYIASVDYLGWYDQDALNHIVDSSQGTLPPVWNSAGAAYGPLSGYSPAQLREAREHPVLRHFVGPRKQWHYLAEHAATYWKYRPLTPWPARKPDDRTLGKMVWKWLRTCSPRFVKEWVGERKRRRG